MSPSSWAARLFGRPRTLRRHTQILRLEPLDERINPAAPTINQTTFPETILEGATLNMAATVHDNDAGDTLTVTWDVNNDGIADATTVVTANGNNQNVTASLTWAQLQLIGVNDGPSQFDTKVTVSDGTSSDSESTNNGLKITNKAPLVTISGPASIGEGTPYTLTIDAVTDPGADTITKITIDWDDGKIESFTGVQLGPDNALSAGDTFLHTYADDSDAQNNNATSRTITFEVTDEDDTFNQADQQTLTVNNVPPVVTLTGNAAVDETSPFTLKIDSVIDPGQDKITKITINWGDGATQTFTGSQLGADNQLDAGDTFTHTYADGDGAGTLRTIQVVSVVDEDGTHTQAATHALTVLNVVPIVA